MMELNIEISEFNGKKVKIIYRGFGRFEKIDMIDEEDNLLYCLQKDISSLPTSEDYKILRREYFNCKEEPKRVYRGWRNSFIEFCRKLPNFENLDFLARELRLSKKILKIYLKEYQKLFGKI